MLWDLLSLVLGSVVIFAARSPSSFRTVLLVALCLAALCWYLCAPYTRLWNKRFHVTVPYHVVCALASVCTLCFAVLFASFYYAKDAALVSIAIWQVQINADPIWRAQTFAKAFANVKKLGTENFSNVPPPLNPGSFIPTNSDRARQMEAATYADEACRNFNKMRPFLSQVVSGRPSVPAQAIFEDVHSWQANGQPYPPSRAIAIAASQIRKGLQPQVPKVIYVSRAVLLALFFLIQSVPFGLIGWSAYHDIKV